MRVLSSIRTQWARRGMLNIDTRGLGNMLQQDRFRLMLLNKEVFTLK